MQRFSSTLARGKSRRLLRLVASWPSAVMTLQDFGAKVRGRASYQSVGVVSSNIELQSAPSVAGAGRGCHQTSVAPGRVTDSEAHIYFFCILTLMWDGHSP